MAIKRIGNWLQQQRVDVPHLRALESAVTNDFDTLIRGYVTKVGYPYVLRGFRITYAHAIPATSIQLEVANSAVFHSSATEGGTILTVPVGTAPEVLNSANTKISGSFTAGTTNYISLDFTRAPDSSTNDLVKFWSPDSLLEFAKTVPLAQTLDYKIVINATGFGTLGTSVLLPLASVVLDGAGLVQSMTDCRPMLFRLGSGGTSPAPTYVYPWPDGSDAPGTGRAENPSTSSGGSIASTPFEGGDKEIGNLKDWSNAVMSRILELDGGSYWYSGSVGSITGLTQNQNVHMLDQGVLWSWDLVTQRLSWSGTVTFQIPGSTSVPTLVTDNTMTGPSSVVIGTGQCAYVVLDRTLAVPGPVTSMAVANSKDVPIQEDTFVFARRDGTDVLIGTHSFRLKASDVTESDYSDHLAKEKLLKPIVNQTAANNTISIYPSQRVSGIKRRYVYISPNKSSEFPRNPYSAGAYDGGTADDQLSIVTFTAINSAADIQISAALPHNTPGLLYDTSTGPTPGIYNNSYTPVLICITSADSFEVVVGIPQGTDVAAKLDAYLPASPTNSYPVAVVIVHIPSGGSAVVQPITENLLLDRRPTGAGGSGGGGTVGQYDEQIATAGQTVFTLPWAYIVGLHDLSVVENGVELFVDITPGDGDYAETSTTQVTLGYPAVAGDRYKFRTGKGLTVTSIGNVVGPAFGGSTDNAIARWNLTTGQLLQNSVGILDDFGNLSGIVDLTMTGTLTGGASPFNIVSVAADGAGAIGFKFNTTHNLVTSGSKILSIQNNSIEYVSLGKGTDLLSLPNTPLFNLYDRTGGLTVQFSTDVDNPGINWNSNTFQIYGSSDYSYAPGYQENYLEWNNNSPGRAVLQGSLKKDGVNYTSFSFSSDGNGFTIDNTDLLGTDGTSGFQVGFMDRSFVGRTDVRANLFCKTSYIGLCADGTFFGGNDHTSPTKWRFQSGAASGAGAIAFELDTLNALVAGDLLHLKNHTVPKFVVDKDGNITTVGTIAGALSAANFTAKGDILSASGASTPVILPVGANPDGYVLALDHTTATGLKWSSAGAGDVLGPGASTDTAIAIWNGASGALLENSLVTLNGFGSLAGVADLGMSGRLNTLLGTFDSAVADGALAIAYTFDTINALVTAGSKLWSLRNNSVEKFAIDKDGIITARATNLKRTSTSINYLSAGETIIGVTDTSTTPPRTITLSNADKVSGRMIYVKDESGGATANPIVVQAQTGTIDGVASVQISVNYGVLAVYSDGSNWWTL